MDKRENLGSLRIPAVDEDQRRHRVNQGEAPELLRVKPPTSITPDDATDHDEHPELLDPVNELPPHTLPARAARSGVVTETKHRPDPLGDGSGILLADCGSHNLDSWRTLLQEVLPVPLLPVLAQVDRVEQIPRRLRDAVVPDGPHIGDRQGLVGGLRQEQLPERSVRRPGEVLDLPQRRPARAPDPLIQVRHAALGGLLVPARPVHRPLQQRRRHLDSNRHGRHLPHRQPRSGFLSPRGHHTTPLRHPRRLGAASQPWTGPSRPTPTRRAGAQPRREVINHPIVVGHAQDRRPSHTGRSRRPARSWPRADPTTLVTAHQTERNTVVI